MQHRFFRTKAALIVPLVMLLVGAFAIGSSPRAIAHGDGEPHPAHIHAGTCAELGDVVAPLANVSSEYLVDGTASAASEAIGPDSAIPVEVSVTTVALPLADIIAGGHAINIHESEANIANYIACGDIGGKLMNGNQLPIGLGTLNDSGFSGVAMLTDDGNGNTTVTVSLIHSAPSTGDEATTADSGEVSADGLAVSIKDFLYNPEPAEVKVGESITWTNEDGVPHTATQKPSGSGFQSGTLATGESFSFTFESAGTFEYFCEFHPNMAGTVIVSE